MHYPPGPHPDAGGTIVRAGRTCWREATAERADVLIDADRYYSALHEALCRAQRSIYIMGWDIDSRVELVREDRAGVPTRLAPLLSHLAAENAALDIRVLAWDFAPIFLFERELLPRVRFGLATHERVHFRLDDAHPAGSSHHQKLSR